MIKLDPPTFGDNLKGMWRSLIAGDGMKFGATRHHVKQAQKERQAKEQFGTGEWDNSNRNFGSPIHATDAQGRPVTVSFGTGRKAGHTLICDGHVDMQTFFAHSRPGRGHDHYSPVSKPGDGGDRGYYSG